LDKGEYETSQKLSEKANSFYQHSVMGLSLLNCNKILIALAKLMKNENDIKLNKIFKWHADIKSKEINAFTLNYIVRILLNIDDQHISEAEVWIKRAIETNQKYGMMLYLARDYALYADLLRRKGDVSQAKEKLSKAIEIFKECGADGWVEKYEKKLAALS
jgi:hypothetical protein